MRSLTLRLVLTVLPTNVGIDHIPASIETPVLVGTDDQDFDACGGVGVISGLDPRGDNSLSVRSGPSRRMTEIYRLPSGHTVYVCDFSEDGAWLGIVFQPVDKAQAIDACGVGTPLTPQPYAGPCLQGCASARYVQLVAG